VKDLFKMLKNGRGEITVVSKEYITYEVSLVTHRRGGIRVIVKENGQGAGRNRGVFNPRCRVPRANFPLSVRGINVVFSDGQGTFKSQLAAGFGPATYALPVRIKAEGAEPVFEVGVQFAAINTSGRGPSPEAAQEDAARTVLTGFLCPYLCEISPPVIYGNDPLFQVAKEFVFPLGRTIALDYEGADGLEVGQIIAYSEYPFQRVGGVLTNGEVTLPIKRPTRGEWHTYRVKYGISSMKEPLWAAFLEALEGRFLQGTIISFLQEVEREVRAREEPLAADPQVDDVQRAIGQMWNGQGEKCTRVVWGQGKNQCVIFILEDQNCAVAENAEPPEDCICVLDNPGIGALWVLTYREAKQLASGEVKRSEMKKRQGVSHIPHTNGWREKLIDALVARRQARAERRLRPEP
jgi:hypothetical protein